jgi:hypothetical protein
LIVGSKYTAFVFVIFGRFLPLTAISHQTATTRRSLYLLAFQRPGGSMAVIFAKLFHANRALCRINMLPLRRERLSAKKGDAYENDRARIKQTCGVCG